MVRSGAVLDGNHFSYENAQYGSFAAALWRLWERESKIQFSHAGANLKKHPLSSHELRLEVREECQFVLFLSP